jgi:hypothetical protein
LCIFFINLKEIIGYELNFIGRKVWREIYQNIEENISLDKGKIEIEMETIKRWFEEYLYFFPDKK